LPVMARMVCFYQSSFLSSRCFYFPFLML
jgi:hypothetical protein